MRRWRGWGGGGGRREREEREERVELWNTDSREGKKKSKKIEKGRKKQTCFGSDLGKRKKLPIPNIPGDKFLNPSLISRTVSEDVKYHERRRSACLGTGGRAQELCKTRNWAQVIIPCSTLPPSLISHAVSVDVKKHEIRRRPDSRAGQLLQLHNILLLVRCEVTGFLITSRAMWLLQKPRKLYYYCCCCCCCCYYYYVCLCRLSFELFLVFIVFVFVVVVCGFWLLLLLLLFLLLLSLLLLLLLLF